MSNNPYERVARPGVCGDLGHKLVDFQCEYCGLIRPVALISCFHYLLLKPTGWLRESCLVAE